MSVADAMPRYYLANPVPGMEPQQLPLAFDVSIANRLREFRTTRGMSRADLARKLGVTATTVHRWERGAARPSAVVADRLETLGFGCVAWHETNAVTIPLIGRETPMSRKRVTAEALKDASGIPIPFHDGPTRAVPAPWVRNGPRDQSDFHHRMIDIQIPDSSKLHPSVITRRLSMVESVEGIGRTAQYALEHPRPTAVSWNSNYGPHGWHRYVGRFPSHVVRALLNHFEADSSTLVCDPFSGSGTTGVECRLLGIPFVGIEICPLSCLISRTKAGFPEDSAELRRLVLDFNRFYCDTEAAFFEGRVANDVSHADILKRPGNLVPPFANVEKWFTPEALLGVSITVEYSMSLQGFPRDALLLALSARMRSIGNVDVDVVRAEYRRTPRQDVNVRKLVMRQLTRMAADIDKSVVSHRSLIGPRSGVVLREGSVLEVELPPGSVHFIITSPPYGVETISYLRTHLLSYRALVAELGHDPYEAKELTIGSEYVSNRSAEVSRRASMISPTFRSFFDESNLRHEKLAGRRVAMMQFFDDMLEIAERFSRWLVPGGRIAFVIGNKRLGEDVIPTDAIVSELFRAHGLLLYDSINHKLKTNNSNSQVPWQERIVQDERIMLFRNAKQA